MARYKRVTKQKKLKYYLVAKDSKNNIVWERRVNQLEVDVPQTRYSFPTRLNDVKAEPITVYVSCVIKDKRFNTLIFDNDGCCIDFTDPKKK